MVIAKSAFRIRRSENGEEESRATLDAAIARIGTAQKRARIFRFDRREVERAIEDVRTKFGP
jgi:hypothetical protein